MPERRDRNQGPWTYRAGVFLFSAALGVLVFWLLGFVVNDIGSWPGPVYAEVEKRLLDPALTASSDALTSAIADTKREIEDAQIRQDLLRDSATSSQRTMDQLVDLQRLHLEKNVTPTEVEQEALAESERLFLANQTEYQRINEELVRLQETQRALATSRRAIDVEMATERKPVDEEYRALARRHDLKMAAIKLLVLTPLLVVAVVLFIRQRRGTYGPIVHAFGLAVIAKVGFVMHEYFPARYFKYVLIVTALLVVLWLLVFLLRMVAFPRRDWLLKQYREAYERFLCPVCSYPIRRGPLKFMVWNRRSIRNLRVLTPAAAQAGDADEPYTCPMCGTCLYEACESCAAIRASLLPACERCGTVKPPREDE